MMPRRTFLNLPAALAGAPPKSEFDYVDWSWQRWRQITHEVRPSLETEQTGRAELVGLSPESRRRAFSIVLGTPPPNKPPLAPKLGEEVALDACTRRKLLYQTEPGEFVPAYLFAPKPLRGRVPAVLCPHQTTQAGKNEPAGIAGDPRLHQALDLAQRGYVTFTYDALCFGERHNPASGHFGDAIPFYRRHPGWSLMSKMAWDLSRAIDYLEILEFVDRARIGCIGHSHGGITTLFAMALDHRIAAGVSNCGFDTFRIDGNVWRWSHATALLPRLGFYHSSPYINMDFYRGVPDSEVIRTPLDLHELLAMIAPRPLLLSTSDTDFVFPNAGWSARKSLSQTEPLYRQLGAAGRLGSYFFRGGHSFPPEASRRAYAWLDRWLRADR